MKLLSLTALLAFLLLSGCAQQKAADSVPSPTTTDSSAASSKATASPASTQVSTSNTETTAARPPEGHLWKPEYEGLSIIINSAVMTKNVFDHEFLVFDLTLNNDSDQSLDVSGRQFNLLTVNKEILGYDPTAETVEPDDNQTATVLPGGQRNLRVGFVVRPEEVGELIFNVGQDAVYRITSFHDGLSPVVPTEGASNESNMPIIEGGNAKSDDFIFEDNYLGYLNSLIEAINTADFSLVEIHLLFDSDLYAQQQKLVETLSMKGAREEVVDYEIQSTSYDEDSSTLTMKVREQIKVILADGIEKTADNVWTYTALQVDQGVFQFSTIANAQE